MVLHGKGWGMRKREGFSHYAKSYPISSTVNTFINQNEDSYGVFLMLLSTEYRVIPTRNKKANKIKAKIKKEMKTEKI